MPAWQHGKKWDNAAYLGYRRHVGKRAPELRGRSEDCADLSMLLLIEYASQEGLPVSLQDNDGNRYRSTTNYTSYEVGGAAGVLFAVTGMGGIKKTVSWQNADQFYQAVRQRIGAKALYGPNTVANYGPPAPGDLMLTETHCALVYKVYAPGERHPQSSNTNIPNFPGPATAKEQFNVTEYFKGTVEPQYGMTFHREPDKEYHFDYLNSRSKHKRNAELLYFANATQTRADGFLFCTYAPSVLE